ncbi:hypothetical protein INR49_012015 [Caranx melampygus]|nr:hypothetical protein INR49_012015 [Caranx melampygus]
MVLSNLFVVINIDISGSDSTPPPVSKMSPVSNKFEGIPQQQSTTSSNTKSTLGPRVLPKLPQKVALRKIDTIHHPSMDKPSLPPEVFQKSPPASDTPQKAPLADRPQLADLPPKPQPSELPPKPGELPPKPQLSDLPPKPQLGDLPPKPQLKDLPPKPHLADIPPNLEQLSLLPGRLLERRRGLKRNLRLHLKLNLSLNLSLILSLSLKIHHHLISRQI